MTHVLIAAANQALVEELRGVLNEIPDIDQISLAASTTELSGMAARTKPQIVILHDQLGPDRARDVVREVTFRAPTTAFLVVNSLGDVESALAVMEAGAKGVLATPIAFEDVLTKVETARQWSATMGGLISGAVSDSNRTLGRHGRVTVVAGAKGGVGATTIATHMAIDIARRASDLRVCLVDLDLQAGDVSAILDARQRVSIADIAKVSTDLSTGIVLDALVRHESGVSLLLTPLAVHETEFVTSDSVRAILGLLRQEFDVIIVDGGSHVTPAQAAAVEVADEVAVVVTPDVLAMRSFRRVMQTWEGLQVRTERDVHVVVNRTSKDDLLNSETLAKLTSGHLLDTKLPSMFRRLERGLTARNPEEVREAIWWSSLEQIGAEIGVVTTGVPVLAEPPAGRRSAWGRRGEGGQVALETVLLVPLVLTFMLLSWQVALSALAFTWNGHAANAAARAQSIGDSPHEAARDAMPNSMRDAVSVSVLPNGDVRVSTRIPVLCPGCASLPKKITQDVGVVEEP